MDRDNLKLVLQRHVNITFRDVTLPPGCYINNKLTGIDTQAACEAEGGTWVRDDCTEPPEGEFVWIVPTAGWAAVFATDAREVEVVVPFGKTLEWPIGWLAHDLETATANWDEMSCRVRLNDSPGITEREQPDALSLSRVVRWRAAEVTNGNVTGVCAGPVVYMAALLAPRTVTVTFSFNHDVFDGWHWHRMGTEEVFVAHLLPRP